MILAVLFILILTASVEAGDFDFKVREPFKSKPIDVHIVWKAAATSGNVEQPCDKDGWCTYADITKTWPTVESSDIIATCDDHYRNCQVIEPKAFPCYQRMQEAMKAMDTLLKNGKSDKYGKEIAFSHVWLYDHWETTYRECVK